MRVASGLLQNAELDNNAAAGGLRRTLRRTEVVSLNTRHRLGKSELAAAEVQRRSLRSTGGDSGHTARSLAVSNDSFQHSLSIVSAAALGRWWVFWLSIFLTYICPLLLTTTHRPSITAAGWRRAMWFARTLADCSKPSRRAACCYLVNV